MFLVVIGGAEERARGAGARQGGGDWQMWRTVSPCFAKQHFLKAIYQSYHNELSLRSLKLEAFMPLFSHTTQIIRQLS